MTSWTPTASIYTVQIAIYVYIYIYIYIYIFAVCLTVCFYYTLQKWLPFATAECSLHEGSHYLVAVLHKDNLPVIPLFNTHRKDTEICHQEAFHLAPFGIIIDSLTLRRTVNTLLVTIQTHAIPTPSVSILNCAIRVLHNGHRTPIYYSLRLAPRWLSSA